MTLFQSLSFKHAKLRQIYVLLIIWLIIFLFTMLVSFLVSSEIDLHTQLGISFIIFVIVLYVQNIITKKAVDSFDYVMGFIRTINHDISIFGEDRVCEQHDMLHSTFKNIKMIYTNRYDLSRSPLDRLQVPTGQLTNDVKFNDSVKYCLKHKNLVLLARIFKNC